MSVVEPVAAPPAAPPASPPASPSPPVSFAETLPEAIRGDKAFTDIKSLDDLAKGYHGLAKKLGVPPNRLVTLPAGDDDAEGHAALRKALGVPAAPDLYEFKDPDGAKIDAELKSWFAKSAHEVGLPAKQAAQLYERWNALMGERGAASVEARNQAAAAATAELQKEWGQAFKQKTDYAERALQHYGGDDVAKYLVENNLHNDPRIVRMFAKMGEQLAQDGIIGKAPGGDGVLSPVEAQQQIHALETDPKNRALLKNPPTDPARKAYLAERDRLYRIAYPEPDKP